MWLVSNAASADSGPFVLLSRPETVTTACANLSGIKCVDGDDKVKAENLGGSALPMSADEYVFLDQQDHPVVKGFLVLSINRTSSGNTYFVANARMFKSGFAGIGMTTTDRYDAQFWNELADSGIGSARATEPAAIQFLANLDLKIEQERAAAALVQQEAAAAAAKKKAAEAYRESPEYAEAQKQQGIKACENQIKAARAAIARDDRMAKISGYENKIVRARAASMIVDCEDYLTRMR